MDFTIHLNGLQSEFYNALSEGFDNENTKKYLEELQKEEEACKNHGYTDCETMKLEFKKKEENTKNEASNKRRETNFFRKNNRGRRNERCSF